MKIVIRPGLMYDQLFFHSQDLNLGTNATSQSSVFVSEEKLSSTTPHTMRAGSNICGEASVYKALKQQISCGCYNKDCHY